MYIGDALANLREYEKIIDRELTEIEKDIFLFAFERGTHYKPQ